jgi:hypothetical protein
VRAVLILLDQDPDQFQKPAFLPGNLVFRLLDLVKTRPLLAKGHQIWPFRANTDDPVGDPAHQRYHAYQLAIESVRLGGEETRSDPFPRHLRSINHLQTFPPETKT